MGNEGLAREDWWLAYPDRGCPEGGPSCLDCPLPRCLQDGGAAAAEAARLAARNRAVLAAYEEGCRRTADLCRRFGLSSRTIHRALAAARAGQG